MKCEKCGHELSTLSVDMFNYDGSNRFVDYTFREEGENAVIVETPRNWVGYELLEPEMHETIRCPNCGKFPFENTEVQGCDVVRLVMFRKGSVKDGDK